VNDVLQVALAASQKARKILLKHFGKLKSSQVKKKSKNELLSFVDISVEKSIQKTIRKRFPQHQFLGEESYNAKQTKTTETPTWIVDPLDGTTNYVNGLPHFSISIALMHQNKLLMGLVLDPLKNETFWATQNTRSKLNGKTISVSKTSKLNDAFIAFGTPYRLKRNKPAYYKTLKKIQEKVCDQRRFGSAALDLCYVASGRFSGFWEIGLESWDSAAGILIVQNAGGMVTDFAGQSIDIHKPNLLATNGKIHNQMKTVFKNHFLNNKPI